MIYCEQPSDTDILNDLKERGKVIVLGCPVCADMSLYIQKATQNTPVLTLTPTGFKAISMRDEVNRLTQFLKGKGLDVASWVGKYPVIALCVPDERNRKKIIKKCKDFEKIITLCCEAGKKPVESILHGKKVIAGMNAIGIVNASLKSKIVYAKLYIDKNTVHISRFTFDT